MKNCMLTGLVSILLFETVDAAWRIQNPEISRSPCTRVVTKISVILRPTVSVVPGGRFIIFFRSNNTLVNIPAVFFDPHGKKEQAQMIAESNEKIADSFAYSSGINYTQIHNRHMSDIQYIYN